jgi:hypothetical protein
MSDKLLIAFLATGAGFIVGVCVGATIGFWGSF